jgi:hypothetical protein
MLYGMGSDQNEIFLPGAFADSCAEKVLFCWEHKQPMGVAVLREVENGLLFRARIMGSRLVVVELWKCWAAGFFRGVCLSSIPDKTSHARGPNGENVTLIHRARADSLSCVVSAGIIGCSITRLGRLDQTESKWDRDFMRGRHIDDVQVFLADAWLTWCRAQKKKNLTVNGENHAEWIASMEV